MSRFLLILPTILALLCSVKRRVAAMASLWLALQMTVCEKPMRLVRGQPRERAVAFKSRCAQSFWSYLPLRDAWAAMRCCWSVLPLPKLNFMAKSDRDFVVACYGTQ